MTREERNTKLKHFITCLKCEVSGRECDDNCPVQYKAGNMGEIIENLEAISKALEQEPCNVFDEYGNYKYPSDVETEPNTATSMPCDDAISRQAALGCCRNEWEEEAKMRLKSLPPVNPQSCEELNFVQPHKKIGVSLSSQPKTGHWIFDEILDKHYYCSECKSMGVDYWDFCPNCGAKMVEPQEREG